MRLTPPPPYRLFTNYLITPPPLSPQIVYLLLRYGQVQHSQLYRLFIFFYKAIIRIEKSGSHVWYVYIKAFFFAVLKLLFLNCILIFCLNDTSSILHVNCISFISGKSTSVFVYDKPINLTNGATWCFCLQV